MKATVLSLILLLSSISFGQTTYFEDDAEPQRKFRRNSITVEHGFYNRGLVGLTYCHNIPMLENLFFSLDGGAGIGNNIFNDRRNYYYYGGAMLNVGRDGNYFMFGLESKYVQFNRYDRNLKFSRSDLFYIEEKHYYDEGFSFAPAIGYNFITGIGFTAKLRATALIMDDTNLGGKIIRPSVGFSMGYSF